MREQIVELAAPHPANTSSHCCGDAEGGHDYVQQAGERDREAQKASFFSSTCVPSPASPPAGNTSPCCERQTKPQLTKTTGMHLQSSCISARRRMIAVDCWIIVTVAVVAAQGKKKKKLTQWNVTKISDDIGLLESFSHNTTADYIYDTLKSL